MLRVLAIGSREETRGLALAGVETLVADEARALERALQGVIAASPPIGLVLLSARAAALVPAAAASLAARGEPPTLVVLPEGGDRAPAG